MLAASVKPKLDERFGADAPGGFELVDGVIDPFLRAPAEKLREVIAFLRDDPELRFDGLMLISGVDYEDRIDVVYHLRSYQNGGANVTVKVSVERDGGSIPSITGLYPAADWHERETFDMLGVRFEGHPNLRRILLPEDWEGHPLRKDYQAPDDYHGISNQ